MKFYLRILLLLMAAVLALSVFVGCDTGGDVGDDTDVDETNDPTSIFPDVERKDYSQDFNIFAFSIAENIKMGLPQQDADIVDAIRKVGLSDVISSLKEGEETYISQRIGTSGTDLSGGEKQLLAIARAVYKKAPICILDEPTAALSPQNEYAVYQKFDEITRGQTVIYISHRLNSCKLADRIVVLNESRIVETGGHAELMEKQGLYHKMFTSQSQYYHTAEISEEGVDDGQST